MFQQEIDEAVRRATATAGRWTIEARSPQSAIATQTHAAADVKAEVRRLQFTEHYQILSITPVIRPAEELRRLPAAELTDAEYVARMVHSYYRLPDPSEFGLLEFTGMTADEYAGWIMHGTVPERIMRVEGRRL